MVSFQFESEAEACPQFLYGICFVATAGLLRIRIGKFIFGNHFVVELLWPRRERRAQRIVTVEFNFFQFLLTKLISESEAEACPQFLYGICFVATAGLSRIRIGKFNFWKSLCR